MKRTIVATFVLAIAATSLAAQDIPLSKILVEKEGWREFAKNVLTVTWLDGEPAGSLAIYHGDLSGRLGASGVLEKIPPPPKGKSVPKWAGAVQANSGHGYGVTLVSPDEVTWVEVFNGKTKGSKTTKLPGLKSAACVTLWPDEGHLVIGEADGAYLWAVRIEKDGSLGPGDRYYSLRTKPNEKMHVTAMVMDAGYLLYACTPLGIQVFDPTGRLSGVIAAPSKEPMTAITIGGASANELFVAAGHKIFARKIQGKATYTLDKKKK